MQFPTSEVLHVGSLDICDARTFSSQRDVAVRPKTRPARLGIRSGDSEQAVGRFWGGALAGRLVRPFG